mmetsp:Transcript_32817/g.60454  ORF Transcript_32817/g.60454 Transcript_32817/m.60454 type:complete len:124 (-) Transcript_32817:721-1092(-)
MWYRTRFRVLQEFRRIMHGEEEARRSYHERALHFWEGMCNAPLLAPELYIYSDDDSLTPADSLEELIDHRKTMFGGAKVRARKFFHSPHCTHLLSYPIEYSSSLQYFLDLFYKRLDNTVISRL